MDIHLNTKQQEVISYILQGKNILITGGAGSGKSTLLKYYLKNYKNTKNIAITSTTGTSAILIGGTTLHSYLGIGLGNNSVDAIVTRITKKKYLKKRWCKLDVLLIDEVSMMSAELFDKLEQIARNVRKKDTAFGGIQLVFSGDFLQLPCIDTDKFCFDAESWNFCMDHIICLDKILRQRSKSFQDCLNYIRLGEKPENVRKMLENRVRFKLKNDMGIEPTKLYPLNVSVEHINQKKIKKLAKKNGTIYEYDIEFKIYESVLDNEINIEKFKKYSPAPETLELTENCQVMLIHNLDIASKLVNGSRGVVIKFIEELPLVRFLNGEERIIDYHIWEMEENDKKLARITQIPLRLGYAYSIHKAQGCTLDYVIIDLSNIFDYGMAYVALSRVKNLDGLSIVGIDWDKIKAHPRALEFYKNLLK